MFRLIIFFRRCCHDCLLLRFHLRSYYAAAYSPYAIAAIIIYCRYLFFICLLSFSRAFVSFFLYRRHITPLMFRLISRLYSYSADVDIRLRVLLLLLIIIYYRLS